MATDDRKNSITDENIVEGGIYTCSRMSTEPSIPKENPRTAIILDSSPRRCIVFKLFTLKFVAHRKLLLPVSPPVCGPERGIHMDSGVHGNLDNVSQASPTSSILLKVDVQKKQTIQMPLFRGPARAYILNSSSRENVARQSWKKTKLCETVNNLSTICLQNSFLSNISSCLICDGSNLIISSALANRSLTVGKRVKRNSKKKTKRKGRMYKRLLHCEGPVQSGIACEESICDASIYESSIINDPSSDEEISEDVLSQEATSCSLPVRVPMEENDSEVRSIDALNPSAATVKYLSFPEGVDKFEQVAGLSDDFAKDLSCNQTGVDECSTSRSNYLSAVQMSDTAITTSSGSTYIGNPSDMSFYFSSNQNNALMLDAVLDAGVSISTACGGADSETQLCTDTISLSSCAEGEIVCNSQQDMTLPCRRSGSYRANLKKLNDFDIYAPCSSEDPVYIENIADRTRCSSEACSSSTSNAFSPVKRGKNSRKISGDFNGLHKSGNTAHARTRKEVNHSVWQRVQKNSCEEGTYECKDLDSVSLQHDTSGQADESGLKDETSLWMGQSGNRECQRYACINEVASNPVSMRTANAVDPTKHLSKSRGKLVNKFPEKLKMDSILVPKQVHASFLKKWSPNGKNDLVRLSKENKAYAVGFSSIPETNPQKSDTSPEKAHSFPSKLWVKEKIHVNDTILTENSDSAHKIDSYASRNDVNLLAKTLDSLDTKCTIEVNHSATCSKFDEDMPPSLCHFANKKSAGWKSDNEGFHAEHKKQENNFVPGLQKWVPVAKRDDGRSELKSVSSGSLDCSSTELDGVRDKSQHSPHCISKSCVASDFHCTQETRDHNTSNSETDLGKIILVVKEAYKLQIASETVQLATGSPLAEFEKLIYSACPVLGQMYSIPSCKSCSQDQCIGNALCQHQIPNISLQNLWQWYEKPGNYGLEVKVEDYLNPKRLGNDKFDFRAYFVPYLSAVQLFGRSAGCTCSDNCSSDSKNNKEHVADSMSKSSSQISNLPIFSVLVPCPHKEAVMQVVDSSASSSSKGDPCDSSVCKACLMAQDVLFEYFESDQPQLRRPLLEKIKELVKGSSFSNSHMFGDPLKLECSKLHDLHPASWFSVAWYPIYRIPDGNFRAAFLTYHSLGHLIHRSTLPKSADGVSHIVSPVVGLQSYNAKGECWFRQRHSSENTAVSSDLAPCEILRERLRTLESTASVMSRALVPRGDQTSVNRQPDYEFFFSRRTYSCT